VTELYQQEQGNLATGGSSATQHTRALAEAAYQKRAESLLSDENCYKVVIVSVTNLSLVRIVIVSLSFVHCRLSTQGICGIHFYGFFVGQKSDVRSIPI